MGYTGTTNYGFQKPAKENAFTVDDLNNALDKIDETIKAQNTKNTEQDGRLTAIENEMDTVQEDITDLDGRVTVLEGIEMGEVPAEEYMTCGDSSKLNLGTVTLPSIECNYKTNGGMSGLKLLAFTEPTIQKKGLYYDSSTKTLKECTYKKDDITVGEQLSFANYTGWHKVTDVWGQYLNSFIIGMKTNTQAHTGFLYVRLKNTNGDTTHDHCLKLYVTTSDYLISNIFWTSSNTILYANYYDTKAGNPITVPAGSYNLEIAYDEDISTDRLYPMLKIESIPSTYKEIIDLTS